MIKVSRLNKDVIDKILSMAISFSEGKRTKAKEDIFVSNLFFEPSVRTKVSFELAERSLGLHVVPFDLLHSQSKKESLYDVVKTLEAVGVNLLVIRRNESEYYRQLEGVGIPIINAGDGGGNHPSQALLDLMTIRQEFETIQGLRVAIVGDVKKSHAANSTTEILRKLGAKVFFSGPREWFDEGSFMNGTYQDLDALIPDVDVLMLLRTEYEMPRQRNLFNPEDYLKKYGLTTSREQRMKPNAIIMHSGSVNRGVEIASDLVECTRSRIFQQIKNASFVRMATLKYILEEQGFSFE